MLNGDLKKLAPIVRWIIRSCLQEAIYLAEQLETQSPNQLNEL